MVSCFVCVPSHKCTRLSAAEGVLMHLPDSGQKDTATKSRAVLRCV